MEPLQRQGRRLVLFAAAVAVALAIGWAIVPIVLLFLTAFILALALDAPVEALIARGAPRGLAVAAVLLGILATVIGFGIVVAPRIAEQVVALAAGFPAYIETLDGSIDRILEPYPSLRDAISLEGDLIAEVLPSVSELLTRVGAYSLSALGVVVSVIILVSIVIFTLLDPEPLARTYLRTFPADQRAAAERAFIGGREGVVGWIRANLVLGAIEAVAVFVVLTLLGVPGAIVWAALAFFAELAPQIGIFLMAIPPVLVALAVDLPLGLTVLVFYVILSQVAGSVLAPVVRSKQMDLHPVFLIFMLLALAATFGIAGALISTPLAAFVSAFYHEFWSSRRASDDELGPGARRMIGAPARSEEGA